MKIFISGGTGFLGNKLVKYLSELGYTINALCHNATKKNLLEFPGVEIFYGDISNISSLRKAMAGCSHVYHVAGYARVWSKDPATYYKINTNGTKNILDIAVEMGIQKMVFTSTAGVLGHSGEKPVTENDERIGPFYNEYEDSKWQAEELCKKYAQEKQLNVSIVNPPRIYGPGLPSESNALTDMIKKYVEGKWRILPSDGKGIGSYVYIDDIIRGHVLAMEKGRAGERYILSGDNASYIDFFAKLANVSGKKFHMVKLPLPIMLLVGKFLMLKSKITGKPPLITPKWIIKYSYDWALDCEKAKNELGYSYLSLEDGLKKTIDWIKINKDLK